MDVNGKLTHYLCASGFYDIFSLQQAHCILMQTIIQKHFIMLYLYLFIHTEVDWDTGAHQWQGSVELNCKEWVWITVSRCEK